ncbi:MAG: hypothetical protein HOW73_02825 [Polyangiaceae bacterium]|nr:hypothetical protein [Polyangiaceae bacterium]
MENGNFVSKLNAAPVRFLAEALEHSLVSGRRTAQDFIRHFPPGEIMTSLDAHPRLRSTFLTVLVGVREKTALRTPSEDAGRLLQAALEERDTDPESIVRTFDPDDRIRYLDAQKVWAFLLAGEFWKVSRSKDPGGHKIAQTHLAYLLDRGIAHGLISHADVIEGITIETLGEKLPRGELTKLIRKALEVGRTGAAFKHAEILDATPAAVLVDHIPLPQIFESVIMPLATAAGYATPSSPKSAEEKRPEEKRIEERRSEEKRGERMPSVHATDEWPSSTIPPADTSSEPN